MVRPETTSEKHGDSKLHFVEFRALLRRHRNAAAATL